MSHAEVAPVTIGELLPKAAGNNLGFCGSLLVLTATILGSARLFVVLPGAMPDQKSLGRGMSRRHLLPLLLRVESIHPRRIIALPPLRIRPWQQAAVGTTRHVCTSARTPTAAPCEARPQGYTGGSLKANGMSPATQKRCPSGHTPRARHRPRRGHGTQTAANLCLKNKLL